MVFLNFEALTAAPLVRDPFEFVIVPNFVHPAVFEEAAGAFPQVPGPGSFPPEALDIDSRFQGLLDELEGASFQRAIEAKFDIDLSGRPKMLTIRGHARFKDGAVHTDTSTKLISVLLYMNEDWTAEGGCLRLLRSQRLDEPVTEIQPVGGTLVAFRRCAASWHGHKPFNGPRRVIQVNWMTKKDTAAFERGRHVASAALKKLTRALIGI